MQAGQDIYFVSGLVNTSSLFFLGITGTWEGYVPTPTDLYLRGNNVANFTASYQISFESGGILNPGSPSPKLISGKSYNYSGYRYLKVQIYVKSLTTMSITYSSRIKTEVYRGSSDTDKIGTGYANNVVEGSTYIISTSLINASFTSTISIKMPHFRLYGSGEEAATREWSGYIYHIWLE